MNDFLKLYSSGPFMTSILTNTSAITALQTLRSLASDLQGAQDRVSSGLRIGAAADNAAYWSISTTMRSDSMAISAAADALGLGAAKVDTAYAGMTSVIEVLTEFQARLVAATEEGVDKAKVQAELDQMKQQVKSIADSASFSGQNWLTTDIADMYDVDINKTHVVSSFVRDGSGGVSTKTMTVDLSKISLFNSAQGGLLQQDARDISTIGMMRSLHSYSDGAEVWVPQGRSALPATLSMRVFSGPLDLTGVGDAITFDVTVDKDEPLHGISPPYDPGKTTVGVTIDKAFLDTHFPSWNGVVTTYQNFSQALRLALQLANTGATAGLYTNYPSGTVEDRYWVGTQESSGLYGSYIEISNLTSQVSSGSHGLSNAFHQAPRGSQMTIPFTSFQVFRDGEDPDGIQVSFSFSVNNQTPKSYSFDRTYVNTLLGKTDGTVSSAAEMVTLLTSLLQADWPDVIISDTGSSVSMAVDPLVDRKAGGGSRIGFSNITVSHEPIPTLNFLDIDIVQNPNMVRTYIDYLDKATGRVVDAAATLGALQTRIDIQAEFAARLASNIDTGIGRLVDADMNEESTRLKALQTQQQLAVQALSISNSAPDMLMQLFR